MPLYEYVCTTCQVRSEELVNPGASEPCRCASCGGQLDRVISVFAAHQTAPAPAPSGGCGRCGDPAGPCQMN